MIENTKFQSIDYKLNHWYKGFSVNLSKGEEETTELSYSIRLPSEQAKALLDDAEDFLREEFDCFVCEFDFDSVEFCLLPQLLREVTGRIDKRDGMLKDAYLLLAKAIRVAIRERRDLMIMM